MAEKAAPAAGSGSGAGVTAAVAALLANLGIVVVALVLEGCRCGRRSRARPLRGDQSWWSFIRTTKQPELAVVLLEDSAAELGLSMAFVGVGLAALTGHPLYDTPGTLAIGVLLAVVAIVLGIERTTRPG